MKKVSPMAKGKKEIGVHPIALNGFSVNKWLSS